MSSFDDYDCENCGKLFRALADSNAVKSGYCSPKCEIEGKGLR